MIRSIDKIKSLGVYQNYTRPAGIKEFAAKNLIYGWNYSGKTTLSRLFSMLEERALHADFSNCEFTFNGGVDAITEKNLHECSLSVRVFNSDFIRNNLFFDSGSCNAILLFGKESEKTQKNIDGLNRRITESNSSIRSIKKKIDFCIESTQEEKKKAAQNIRQQLKVDPYTAIHLSNDILALTALAKSQLLSEKDLADAIELALTPDSKKPLEVEELLGRPFIEALHQEAVVILAAAPLFSNTIKHLEENPEFERWVESGLHLHPDPGACEFCGNQITCDQLEAFRSHFSKDFADHKAKVQRLLDQAKVSEFDIEAPKAAEINPQFREAYQDALGPFLGNIKKFNAAVKALVDEIAAKVENPRKTMQPSPLPNDLEGDVVNTITAINAVIKDNNILAVNFINARSEALKKARAHFVQEAADRLEFEGWERKKALLSKRSERLCNFIKRLQAEVDRLQAEISQAQQGRERINERLSFILGSEAIQINVTKDDVGYERFQLVRKSGEVATNLSDGERTAIAFSYFLTKLSELKSEDFRDTIVYIDDPISSLDNNHIFHVTAAINDMFFTKVNNKYGKEVRTITCKQIFISTHNFEFFNLMRELRIDGEGSAPLFLIKRSSGGQSELRNMPNSLARYKSEYQFLFDQIYAFHNSSNKIEHEHLFILPNALRRFVELYTFSRIPSGKGETVDHRAVELFGNEQAKSVLKFLHMFSHGNTIERLTGNSELIFLLEETVKAVFDELQERDSRHWKALIAAIES